MAAYNRWMNEKLYAVCAELSDEDRKANRHAFFGSVHGTLNHLLVGDKVWMGRFMSQPFTPSGFDQELHSDFSELRRERSALDAEIGRWAAGITEEMLRGKLRFTSIADPRPREHDMWICVTHFFNHQTHHRGQLTALLSQVGKDYGVTDLIHLASVG